MLRYTLYNLVNFAVEKPKNCPAGPTAENGSPTNDCVTNFWNVGANAGQITAALTIVFGVIGGMAVLYTVLAGLKFVNSQGDPQKASQARRSIIYGALGIAVAVSAEIIVNLVLTRL